ncbi:hypothetical protein GIY23_13375 [Allosaccharopolyspora coralli]|uniref:Ferredoxin n=1 Tax=Allosaccharopolyspora coralli TaxID=2665642 RepID=A0A5Q3QFY9_9PSEU|nr:hypothetical protein [Allosaccharopolyspora coralli]QGK70379.1 hypothetical protein GIY23_13375 [Allosaccharopolyspora coralli]
MASPHWAKAPTFADRPEIRAELTERTAADRAEYLASGLRPIECDRCGTCVRVKKNSRRHTSVQWDNGSAAGCAVFAEQRADGRPSALIDSCPDLAASIDAAVRDGRLRVGDQDQEQV